MIVLIILAKLILLSAFIDTHLYWMHRLYHTEWCPAVLKRAHAYHHASYGKTGNFSVSVTEFMLAIIPPFFVCWYLLSWWFFPIVVAWGMFEAARGHGHFKWFKIIPRAYYKFFRFCGNRYHAVHHTAGGEHVNLGQMLRVWDDICRTGVKHEKAIRAVSKR